MNDDYQNLIDELHTDVREAIQIFSEKLFKTETYSEFCTLHSDLELQNSDHSCLGCNLNDISNYTKKQLEQSLSLDIVENIYTQILISLYLMVERIDTILNLIDLDDDYRKKNYKATRKIRKWANFIKHPKAFILVHHSVATFEGFKDNNEFLSEFKIKIGEPFISTYYSNDSKNEELLKKLKRNDSVIIVYPNIVKLISEFSDEMLRFNQMIRENKIYRNKLADLTTFSDYWVNIN